VATQIGRDNEACLSEASTIAKKPGIVESENYRRAQSRGLSYHEGLEPPQAGASVAARLWRAAFLS
jgi:hypothetical protein